MESRIYVYCVGGVHEFGSMHGTCPRCKGKCFHRVLGPLEQELAKGRLVSSGKETGRGNKKVTKTLSNLSQPDEPLEREEAKGRQRLSEGAGKKGRKTLPTLKSDDNKSLAITAKAVGVF